MTPGVEDIAVRLMPWQPLIWICCLAEYTLVRKSDVTSPSLTKMYFLPQRVLVFFVTSRVFLSSLPSLRQDT